MRKISLMIGLVLMVVSCSDKGTNAPVDLKIEYGSVISDTNSPRFSWILNDDSRGASQSAYQILVASKKSLLTEKKADLWNSGKIESDQTVFVDYKGGKLTSGQRYYWTVRSWNQDELVSKWADTKYFDVGLLKQEDWSAKWIGTKESEVFLDSLRPPSILLRKEFETGKEIALAKAYVTGLGSYQLYLNGEKTGKDLLTPGWTDYPQRVLYQVYDVTEQIKKGNNAIGIILGNAWYSSGLGWNGNHYYSQGPLKALFQLEIEYKDGSSEKIISDQDWSWTYSPILENTLYHGESYDARKEIDSWAEAGLDDENWKEVDLLEMNDIILSAHISPPIQITREIKPVKLSKLENGSYVFDMGINITGTVRLNVEGKAGTKVVMKFAELLHEDGTVAQENLRTAKARDTYILKGGGPESWEPAFTYHGFRYVEVSGYPGEADISSLTALNFHNAAEIHGAFSCSDSLLNKLQANIVNGQKSNMFSVPTDCPQRDERLGWMGDAQIFAATSCYNMDMSGFYAKWIRDIADGQAEEGYVHDVNPPIVVTDPAKPAWGDAFVIVPWEVYRFYGDTNVLSSHYDKYKKWVTYMQERVQEDGLYIYDRNGWGGYADWIAVVESPKQAISAAYYYYSTYLLSEFARILNKTDDYEYYSQLANEIAAAFQDRFFDDTYDSYEGGTQTALLLPLNFNITPTELREVVAENLVNDVIDQDYHPTTGFLGTKYLLPTLSDFGYDEVAWKTIKNEAYPGWLYMINKGATSIWELWNSDTEPPDRMNSRNHFALGSVGEWFYSHLAGIRIDDMQPGFKHTIIKPTIIEELDWVKGSIKTPYGNLVSNWESSEEGLIYELQIPANTTASFYLQPEDPGEMAIYENNKLVMEAGEIKNLTEGIERISITSDEIQIELLPGSYLFKVSR